VAIIAGGRSSEHEISLASARSVAGALDPERYDIAEVAIGRDGRWALESPASSGHVLVPGTGTGPAETLPVPAESGTLEVLGVVDVVLPLLHGPFGEDGTVQGLLELADVPYVGAGVAASALAMDKDLFKKVMRDSGIPVAAHHAIRLGDEVENPFGYPVFVKPARLGSSVGISKVHSEDELRPAVELAFRHDEKVLVEEFVPGIEVEVGVLGNRNPVASLVGEIVVTRNEWYDYSAKYDEGAMRLRVPADLPESVTAELQDVARRAFEVCGCSGMARIDFFVTPEDRVVLNEINTIPGFTSTSVYAELFEAIGIGYPQLLERLIELALERHADDQTYAY
jgi:D-alanine-D-alanine ligase